MSGFLNTQSATNTQLNHPRLVGIVGREPRERLVHREHRYSVRPRTGKLLFVNT